MKIKQVMAKTGLTDRAIRLYIENELVKPECDENYNGRKSIEFSENDVENLKNIALLRKADFSIQEIKSLQIGGETAQNTIKEYINRTNEKIQFSSEIIEKIGTLADEENITIEIICEKLSSNLINEQVPAEDMELPPKEKVVRVVFSITAILGMVVSVLFTLFIVLYYNARYLYPKFYDDFFVAWKAIPIRMLFIIQFLLCFVIFLLIKKRKSFKKKKDNKNIIVIVLTVLWLISWLVFPSKMVFTFFASPIYSHTTNPSNYLRLDVDFYRHIANDWRYDIYEVFPTVIPSSATMGNFNSEKFPETTKYYYKYETVVEEKYDLFAEWKLPEVEFIAEKERVLEKQEIKFITQKGDWQCIYFSESEWMGKDELFFAYNDSTRTVRYVAMSDIEGLLVPYYTTQEW